MPVRVWGERCVGVVGELVKSQREAHIQVKSTLHSEEPGLGACPRIGISRSTLSIQNRGIYIK